MCRRHHWRYQVRPLSTLLCICLIKSKISFVTCLDCLLFTSNFFVFQVMQIIFAGAGVEAHVLVSVPWHHRL